MAKAVAEMTRAELLREYDRAQAEASKLCSEAIAMGLGNVRGGDIAQMDTKFGRRYAVNSVRVRAVIDEQDRRMRYQGNLHKIKPSKWLNP